MSKYAELLKDPRWQKRRLEVFQRAGFCCECCGEKERTLHVHHLKYSWGTPWKTGLEYLECLCKVCHEFRTDFDRFFDPSTVSTKDCWDYYVGWEQRKSLCLGKKQAIQDGLDEVNLQR